MMLKRQYLFSLALATLLALTGCKENTGSDASHKAVAFKNTDITGIDYAKDFSLTDHTGKARSLADFKGKVIVVFFGYTQCPDVCPTTMTEMASVLAALGPLAEKVQVLFITLDPDRDTQALLAQYVPAFDPSFIGLRGDKAATEKTAKEYKVFFQKVAGKQADTYTLDHTASTYVYDPQGRVRLYMRHGQGIEPVVNDIKLLLQSGS